MYHLYMLISNGRGTQICMLIFVVFIFVLSIKCRAMGQSRKLI